MDSNAARKLLAINGGFSLLSGLILNQASKFATALLFSQNAAWQEPVLVCVGAGLIFFSLSLFVASSMQSVPLWLLKTISALDFGWLLASAAICLVFSTIFTTAGLFIICAVACVILCFAILQSRSARLPTQRPKNDPPTKAGFFRKALLGVSVLGVSVSSVSAISGGISAQAHLPQEPEGRMYSINGQPIHMVCMGETTDVPTLIVDVGITNWSLHWSSIQSDIGEQQRICVYDRPGFGRSLPMASPVTTETLVNNLHQVLAASGEQGPFILVGHSFGGYVMRLYHDQYPENVAGIALVDASHEDQWQALPSEVNAMIGKATGMMRIAQALSYTGVLRVVELPPTDPLPTELGRETLASAMTTPQFWDASLAYFEAVPHLVEALQTTERLGDLPLLVITAERSADAYCGLQFGIDVPCEATEAAWQSLQGDLLELSTSSQQVVVEGARHYIQLDDPDAVRTALVEFAHGLAATR